MAPFLPQPPTSQHQPLTIKHIETLDKDCSLYLSLQCLVRGLAKCFNNRFIMNECFLTIFVKDLPIIFEKK